MSTPDAKPSYLSAGINAISPWGSRNQTPQTHPAPDQGEPQPPELNLTQQSRGADHTVTHHRHRLSLKKYPRDCPPLVVQWFHAVDIPKRKALVFADSAPKPDKPPQPKKWSPFSPGDSRAIEATFQKICDEAEETERKKLQREGPDPGEPSNDEPRQWQIKERHVRWERSEPNGVLKAKVPVNEDFLFDVDVEERELAPAYWIGAVYEEQPKTHRLFGAHMNSVVTYQDSTAAWLLTDDFLSRMSSTMYQRFAGGGHFAGVKLIRGFVDLKAEKEKEKEKAKKKPEKDDKETEAETKAETPTKPEAKAPETSSGEQSDAEETPSEARRRNLERQMSNLMASTEPEDLEKQEEEVRKRAEREIREDYKEQEGEEQGREIEHLLLVTHGIGQRLGMRMESVNFVHDVNTLRKTMKSVYANSADLQALNNEVDKLPKNCRVQVLPIVWRHLLDFPKQSLKHNRREFDLGDAHSIEDDEYPSLENITVDGVPAVRNLITDLALDVLLYQSPAYKSHISRIVLQECNRIHKLFKERNPDFNGKVSLVGHSLGSAIMFDLLCQQREERSNERYKHHRRAEELKLEFDVEDFYALGSPIGLFQMLHGKTIAARISQSKLHPESQLATEDPFLGDPAGPSSSKANAFEITTSSPRCQRIFNIFHPTDPISYRLEPLISPAMSALKPQPLPYTKKGIFGAPVAQGLTGIGARVGQSVSGLWSSLSSGIASSLLNRSLGLTAEDASKLGNPVPSPQSRSHLSAGAGTNVSSSVVSPTAPRAPSPDNSAAQEAAGMSDDRKRKLAQHQQGSATDPTTTPTKVEVGESGEHPPTLIDSEMETLYSGFARRRESQRSDGDTRDLGEQREWQEIEERSRKLRREEAKVRALNSNGRVDYSIQEGAFDISLLASIASHLAYYADEDVSHFMISQLLARHRVLKKSRSAPDFKR
ncbi:putative ddhd domain-containing protein [Neofusicoccum parvum UCRNP2]|uniref:Putative ddhd domain-containing protein n=1 Tax=Botryosphaeria parva (strain UCR-NP2) TaxID=1287680 RepID=R1EFF5_BOTPV|nr:putative ddhd domain-containing protein [Neofusicoccum parvum UCRNP2]